MGIPIQWNTKESNASNESNESNASDFVPPGINIINGGHSSYCNNFNGNLNMWDYGITEEHKNRLSYEYSNVGVLAQYETVNSPYYTQVEVDPEYINYLIYLKNLRECNKRQRTQ